MVVSILAYFRAIGAIKESHRKRTKWQHMDFRCFRGELEKNFPFDYEISWDKRNHAVEVSFY